MTIYQRLSDMIEQTRFAEDGAQSYHCKQLWKQNHDKLVNRRNALTIRDANTDYGKLSHLSITLGVSPWTLLEAFSELKK